MGTNPKPDWQEIYRALADDTHREIIRYLLVNGDSTLDELATEFDEDGERRERRVVRLYHVTLPVMSEAGLLEWDSEADQIELSNVAYEVPLGALSPPEIPVVASAHGQRAGD